MKFILNPKLRIPLFLVLIALGITLIVLKRYHIYPGGRIRNVLLISIDTCRADYLSCYGYFRKTTPNLDALAKQGVLFENALTPAPITLPAHSSMLTGTDPPYHGIHDNYDYYLAADNITLAEVLQQHDFSTAAVIGSFVLDSRFGLNQGFDYYNDRFEEPITGIMALNPERRAGEVSRVACQWLEQHRDEKFFLFLHYFDPHVEYVPPEPFASQYVNNLYAGEIAYTDHCIGQVITQLKELDLYDSTLIIVTSDHGESLGEHGELTHAYFIYQATMHVPLIFKLPCQEKARRIKARVGIVDILPTICNLLKIAPPDRIQGRDLSNLITGRQSAEQERFLFCESLFPQKYNANPLLGVVTDRFKYIQTTRSELYDLSTDPREKNNLINQQPQRARLLQGRLNEITSESLRRLGPRSQMELDEQARQKLQSLGYVADGKVEADFSFDQSKDDPKDLIGFHLSINRVDFLIRHKKYAEAENLCRLMISQRPGSVDIYMQLSIIANQQQDKEKAVAYLHQAIAIDPDHVRARNTLGKLLMELSRLEQAEEQFRESLRIKPEQIIAHNFLSVILVEKGDLTPAVQHYGQSLQVKPEQPKIQASLADVYMQLGRLDDALEYWSLAVAQKPDWLSLNNLAWIKAVHENPRYRDPEQALEFALQACQLTNYEDPVTLDTLAAAYAAAGEFADAVRTAQKAESIYLSLDRQKMAESIRQRLKLYQSEKPYREKL